MPRLTPLSAVLGTVLLLASPALWAANATTGDAEDRPLMTIKVTDQMLRGALGRVADQMGERYLLDPYQRERTREVLVERVGSWVRENSDKAEPLVNFFIQSTTGETPPTASSVADWAQDALPVVDDILGMADGITEEMREYLSDDQIAEVEVDRDAIRTVAQVTKGRLVRWREGEFDPHTEWVHGPGFREGAGREDEQLRQDIERARTDAVAVIRGGQQPTAVTEALKQRSMTSGQQDKDPWSQYVEAFIRKFALNEEQASKARTILKRALEQRDDWLSRRGEAFDRLLADQAKAKSENEIARVIVAAERLMQPIDSIEQRMKASLNKLPTRAQRQQARESESQPSARP